jgi:cytochrome c-type biogenesis protein CcmH/NrfG
MANGVALALFDMASTFYNDQSHESAVVFARISLALNPNLIEAKLLIANILAGQNRLSDAIDLYQEIPKTDPRYVAVQQRLASLRVDQGQDHDAIQTLNAFDQ